MDKHKLYQVPIAEFLVVHLDKGILTLSNGVNYGTIAGNPSGIDFYDDGDEF